MLSHAVPVQSSTPHPDPQNHFLGTYRLQSITSEAVNPTGLPVWTLLLLCSPIPTTLWPLLAVRPTGSSAKPYTQPDHSAAPYLALLSAMQTRNEYCKFTSWTGIPAHCAQGSYAHSRLR